jgi:hypothetical protein
MTVKKLIEEERKDHLLNKYLPSKEMLINHSYPSKNFFFTLVSSLNSDYLDELMSKALKDRNK